MLDLIRKRYPAPAYALLEEVANRTGALSARADALAFSLWSSNGIALHGFEIKQSRQDLVRELRDPTKAEHVSKYCDYWWLVVSDEKLLASVEVPRSWGVLAPRLGVLHTIKKAPKRAKKAWTPLFVASLMRRFSEGSVPAQRLRELNEKHHAELDARSTELAKRDVENAERETAYAKERADRLQGIIDEFQRRSGVAIDTYERGNIADAVRIVTDAAVGYRYRRSLPSIQTDLEQIARAATDLAAKVQETEDKLAARGKAEIEVRPTRAELARMVQSAVDTALGEVHRQCGDVGTVLREARGLGLSAATVFLDVFRPEALDVA